MADSEAITVPINGDATKLEEATKKAEQTLTDFEKTAGGIMHSFKGQWDALAAKVAVYTTAIKNVKGAIDDYIVNPIKDAIGSFITLGDTLSKTSQRLGMSVDMLGGLKFAAEQCGANFEALTNGIRDFHKNLAAAQSGDAGGLAKFTKLGVDPEMFAGLNDEESFLKMADHLATITDRATQARVAMELFGEGGFKLLPLFQEGAAGIQKLVREGKEVGAVMGEEAAGNAVALADAINRMKTSFQSVVTLLVGKLAPTLTTICDFLSRATMAVSGWCRENKVLIGVITVFAGVLALLEMKALITAAAVGVLQFALKGLWIAFLGFPYLVALAAITAAISGIIYLLNRESEQLRARAEFYAEAAKEAERETKALEDKRAEDDRMFARLQELQKMAETDPLMTEQILEAQGLIATLTDRYGDLGIQIDTTTGKIKGLDEAQKKAIEAANILQIQAIEKELKTNRDALAAMDEEIEERAGQIRHQYGRFKDTGERFAQSAIDKLAKQQEPERSRLEQRQKDLYEKLGILAPDTYGAEEADPWDTPAGTPQGEELTALTTANQEQEEKYKKDKTQFSEQHEQNKKKVADAQRTEYQRKLDEIDAEYKANVEPLDSLIELEKGRGHTASVAKLEEDRALFDAERTRKITELNAKRDSDEQKRRDDEQKRRDEEQKRRDEEAKKRQAHMDKMPAPVDPRLANPKARATTAEAAYQQAVIDRVNGVGSLEQVTAAEKEWKTAKTELAKTVAVVSGEARKEAKTQYEHDLTAYQSAVVAGEDSPLLDELWKRVEASKTKYDKHEADYRGAIDTIRASIQEKAKEAAVKTTSAGTFSAWEAGELGTDIATKQLLALQSIDKTLKRAAKKPAAEPPVPWE